MSSKVLTAQAPAAVDYRALDDLAVAALCAKRDRGAIAYVIADNNQRLVVVGRSRVPPTRTFPTLPANFPITRRSFPKAVCSWCAPAAQTSPDGPLNRGRVRRGRACARSDAASNPRRGD